MAPGILVSEAAQAWQTRVDGVRAKKPAGHLLHAVAPATAWTASPPPLSEGSRDA